MGSELSFYTVEEEWKKIHMKLENVPKLPAFQKMYFKLTTHLEAVANVCCICITKLSVECRTTLLF